MKTIRMHKMLPDNLRVKTMDSLLYDKGIVFFKFGNKKRKFIYNPYFIFFMEMVYLTRSIVSLVVPESHRQYFVYSGDYMYFIRAKAHINIAATQYMMLGISILIMNFTNYHINKAPLFLESLKFLSGNSTPRQCGLRSRKNVMSLIIKAHFMVNTVKYNTRLVMVISFVLSILPLAINNQLAEVLMYGLPWSAVFALSSYYTFSCYFWNMCYFYIVCHMVKYRLREINEFMKRIIKNRHLFRKWNIVLLEANVESISRDVQNYNNNYWSLYLFICIFFLSTFINSILYTALFMDLNLTMRVSFFYAFLLGSSAVFFLLNTASVVYYQCSKCRTIMSSLYAILHNSVPYRDLFKVGQ